jgi:uncharacterized protein YqgC (DUF456 family)
MEQFIGLLLALAVMGVAVVGCILPGLPGTPLALAAVLAHKLYFGDTSVRWWVFAVFVLLTGMAMALDYVAAVAGAKKMGASRWGMFGALAGLLVGVGGGFFLGAVGSLLGLFVGPLLGAVLLERATGRPKNEAWRAGLGAAMGLLAGALGKAAVTGLIALLFTIEVLWQSLR